MHRQVDRGNVTGVQTSPVPYSSAYAPERSEILWNTARGIPRPGTPLFDRESDIERLCEMLDSPDIRLLTITGPGGVGKTRIALETTNQVAHRFPDGVIAISLAPIRDPAHVLPSIAHGAGLQLFDPRDAESHLIAALHEQRALLLLDNCEQVLEAAPGIAQVLNGCPHLKVLATSRAPLNLAAERIFQAMPLSFGSVPVTSGETLPGAIQLFVTRAKHGDPGFALDHRNAHDIQEICRRLDGLPLAIELAAARVRTISPRELLERLEPSLPMLIHGSLDFQERQQTMRAAIAWSYELLSGQEQRLFRWLSVFVGGFFLRAAESIVTALCATEALPLLTAAELVESIDSLVTSNLLQKTPGNGREYRYAMLEVVREYGLELLRTHDEQTAAFRAHAAWYASIREWLDPNRYAAGERFIDHLWDIDAEHPNLRVALARSSKLGDAERVLQIAGNAAIFWHHRGFLAEGRAWLEQGLAKAPVAVAETRCWGLAGLGLICWTQGDARVAEPPLLEALEMAETLEHQELRALNLHLLALVDASSGNRGQARERAEQALTLWTKLQLPSDQAMALSILSNLPPEPGMPDHRDRDGLRALEIFESIGHPSGTAFALHRLGRLDLLAGDERRAFRSFAQSIERWLSVDERWAIAMPLVLLANMAMRHGRPQEAGTLLGVVEQRLRSASATLTNDYRAIFDELHATLSKRLGTVKLETVLLTGRRFSAEEIESEIADLEARIFDRALLSPREVAVLKRIAAGDTDREIADALFVSPRTVNSHVGHILTKLDVPSRKAAVKRALELDLIQPE
jgi:predicted ATPase/DNA-binding CsgD family transcriptional regulator